MIWEQADLDGEGLRLKLGPPPRRRLSELGRKVLAEKPQAINVKFLKRFPFSCEFIGKKDRDNANGVPNCLGGSWK